jgi:hypothetical protein
MKYFKNYWKPLLWETEEIDCTEEEANDEIYRLEENYPNAKTDGYQDEDNYPYLWYFFIKFENEADEAEFIMRESL